MRKNNFWQIREIGSEQQADVDILINKLGISKITAELLAARGYTTPEQADYFLNAGYAQLSDPFAIPGMRQAADRILRALEQHEKIMIYGDYDADGVCSVAILSDCLNRLGGRVTYFLPSRFAEGYGLHEDAVRAAAASGVDLLITVDCGITSVAELQIAAELGLEVIITDHHEPGNVLPDAKIIVNPKLADCETYNELAGAGVVFQLVRALATGRGDLEPRQWLDIAALATVADIVPLTGDNRIIVKEGLTLLQRSDRPGLKALIEAAGLTGKRITSYHLGYVLGPRLNAVGRMGEADAALELLLAVERRQAVDLAEKLNLLNRQRQDTEAIIMQEALSEAEICAARDDQAIVIGRQGWHQGVIGIIASRLVDKYKRPAIVVSWDGDKGRGSGRSIQDVDLHQALAQCSEYLEKFGGHQQAAGIVLARDKFEAFRAELSRVVADSGTVTGMSRMTADILCSLPDLSIELVQEISQLEPFGAANQVPRFMIRRIYIGRVSTIGRNGEHVKFSAEDGTKKVEAIGFGWGQAFDSIDMDTYLYDLICELELNEYNGTKSLQLKIVDIKASMQLDHQPPSKHQKLVSKTVFEKIEEVIRQKVARQPVVIIYPTVRCLEKHLVGLSGSFPAHCLEIMHGRVPRTAQNTALESLIRGRRKVFLTTESFFKYYINNRLSKDEFYGIALWPGEQLAEVLPPEVESCCWSGNEMHFKNIFRDNLISEVGTERRLFYTNRRNTLRSFAPILDSFSEADVQDLNGRRQSRQAFLDQPDKGLFIDGACGGGLFAVSADRLVLLDLPFGEYEIFNCIAQSRDIIKNVDLCIPEDAKEFNRQFVNAFCPEEDWFLTLVEHIRSHHGRKELPFDGLNQSTNPMLGRLYTRSCLEILRDTGHCDFAVQQNSFQVWFTGQGKDEINPEESLYYLEGLQEKRLLEELINRQLEGDSSGH
ncbi:MAG: single-stranded-DNA-specific exonuclease RecJ [Candidatus Saccharibacteria bacterium]